MRSMYRSERKTAMREYSKTGLKRQLALLRVRLHECERFYPWPALVSSIQADIDVLEKRLAAIKE